MVKWGQLIEGGKSPWTKITPSSFLKIERSAQKEEWYFSVQDVVAVLSESADPKQYTKKMRARDPQLSANWGCCKIKSYLQQHLSFFRRAIRGVPNITFFGSSEAGSCRKRDFCVRQTDLLRFCCSRKVISGCFQFKQSFFESSVCKPTAQFSDIECCCEDKKAGFVVGLPSGEESSEPVILF